MQRKLAVWLVALLLALPTAAFALGLGKIKLNSALNQPLNAEIPLFSVRSQDLETLKVGMASNEAFERAGVNKSLFVTQINFQIKQKENGKHVVLLTSQRPVQEPFLDFLVEINWAKGKMVREFTVLVDPPVMAPARTKTPAKPVKTVKPGKTDSKAKVRQPKSGQSFTARPTTTGSSPRKSEKSARKGGTSYGPVKRGQTLWNIASEVKPNSNVSNEQVMMALYRVNPEAFAQNNINALKAGRILTIPTLAEIENMNTAQARNAVREQTRAWRQGLASPASKTATAAVTKPSTKPSAKPAATQTGSTGGTLKIIAPKDPGTKTAQASGTTDSNGKSGEEVARIRGELALAKEQAATQKLEKQELERRVGDLEKQLESMERLLTLKDQELEKLQKQSGIGESVSQDNAQVPPQDKTDVTQPVDEKPIEEKPADDNAAVSTPEKPEQPAKPEQPQQKPAQPKPEESARLTTPKEPETVETRKDEFLLEDPKVWALGAGLLLLIFVLLWVIVRSLLKHGDHDEVLSLDDSDETGSTTIITSVEPDDDFESESEEDESGFDDFEAPGAKTTIEKMMDSLDEDEVPETDVISEVEVYLAYGRFDQAESLLKKAINEQPDNSDLQLKLLKVYQQMGDTAGFENQARAFFDLIGDPADARWLEVAEMGRQFVPGSDLFGDGDSTVVQPAVSEPVTEDEPVADKSAQDEFVEVDEPQAEMTLEDDELELDGLGLEDDDDDDGSFDLEGSDLDFDTEDEISVDDSSLEEEPADNVIEFSTSTEPEIAPEPEEEPVGEIDLSDLADDADDDFGSLEDELQSITMDDEPVEEDELIIDTDDEVGTKLDLAKAYIDMGDSEGASSILREVVEEGSDEQKSEAQSLLDSL